MAALGYWLALSLPLSVMQKEHRYCPLLGPGSPLAEVLAFIVISPAVIISVGALALAGL